MRLCIVGSGYVGLVAAGCFANTGNHVIGVDIDAAKVQRLMDGIIPIYEPGLEELIQRNIAEGRLTFTTATAPSVQASSVIFIAVGTPPGEDGSADLQHVIRVAEEIGDAMNEYKVVVVKSTVPVGTCDLVQSVIASRTTLPFDVVSNPEFLKEGAAVPDFQKPDRVVIGTDSRQAIELMEELYAPFMRRSNRLFVMDRRSSEMTKYASNAMLATKISFMNEIARLCDAVGADVEMVRVGMSADERIGPHFIYPGAGYGGSCLVGHESVLVRCDGRTTLTTLSALFKAHAGGAPDDPAALALAAPGLEVLSWAAEDATPTFRPVAALTRRGYEGELIEVRTKMGRRVSVTPDHPFVVLGQDGSTSIRLAGELTTEDWLPLARGAAAATGEPPKRLDVLSFLDSARIPASRLMVRLGESGRAALDALDFDQLDAALAPLEHERGRERARDIRRNGTLKLNEALLLDLPLDDATFGTAKNGTYIPRWLPLDARFFRVLGLYLAEGHIAGDGLRRRLSWSFHPRDEGHLVDEVATFWRQLGVKVDVRQGTTTMLVSISSRLLAGVWQALGAGTSCYDHSIPDLVWERSAEEQRALLSGAWQGDGSWSLVNGGPSVVLEYGTVSRPLADGLLRLLAAQGIVARLKIGRAAKSTCDTYWFIISGADHVEAMIELVAPHQRQLVLDNIHAQHKRIAPTGTRELGLPGAVGARITALERRAFQGYVYSMEVPGAHTFVTSFGLVVHNCFPKDIKALVRTGSDYGVPMRVLQSVEQVNELQKKRCFEHLVAHFGPDLSGRTIALWGLAFKPRTDDMREAPSEVTIRAILDAGGRVRASDPVALDTARVALADVADRVELVRDEYACVEGCDALVVCTEWNPYRNPDFDRLQALLKSPVLVDGRNIYRPSRLRERGFHYYAIGRPAPAR